DNLVQIAHNVRIGDHTIMAGTAAVAGSTQIGAHCQIAGAAKKVAGKIKGELAQYREMAAFAQFGTDLDVTTQRMLARGSRLTELLKQPQFSPLPISLMAASLFAVNKGYFDDIEVKKVLAFEAGLHGHLKTSHGALLQKIEDTKALDKDSEAALAAAIADFKKSAAY
ncbi:MAG: hypothetical protein ACLGI6_08480, partial [Gammaproteobacteria bacterium]